MRSIGGCAARAAGVLCVVAFVVVLPLAIGFAALNQVFLDRATYTNALAGEALYTALIPHLLPDVVQGPPGAARAGDTGATVAALFGNLTSSDWEAISGLLIPKGWLRQQIEANINAFFDWLESDEALPGIEVDMTPVKQRLTGPEGREAANILMTSWTPCTAEQEAAMQRFLDGAGPFVLCQPPGRMLAEVSAKAAEPALRTLSESFPDSFSMRRYVEQSSNTVEMVQELNRLKYTLNVSRRLALVSYLIPAAFLALIVIVVVRNAKAFFGWMGATLLAGGLASLLWPVILLLAGLGALDPMRSETAEAIRQGGPLMVGATQGLVNALIGAYAQPMLAQAALVVVVGFVALVAAMALRSRAGVPAAPGVGAATPATPPPDAPAR